jgi:uncharacterized protein YgiM (DUF1202 family)
MAIQTFKASDAIANALKSVANKEQYCYGSKGEILTLAKLNQLRSWYPGTYNTTYYNKTLRNVGKYCNDCSGGISDWYEGTLGEKSSAVFGNSGKIVTVKDAPIGAVLWKSGHVGLKYTATQQIEFRGVDYGATIQLLSSQKWINAHVYDNIIYDVKGAGTIITPPSSSTGVPYVGKIVNCEFLNIRSGPSSSYGVAGSTKKGTQFTITEEANGWGKINSNKWISLKYVQKI